MLDRPTVVARLREIADLLAAHGGSRFKARAFARGARASRLELQLARLERRRTSCSGCGTKLSLGEAWRLARAIEEDLRAMPGVREVEVVGDVARSVERPESVALVVVTSSIAEERGAMDHVASLPRAARVEARTERGCRLRLGDGTRIEIVACTPTELPTVRVAHASSSVHWKKLQSIATSRELQLDERALRATHGEAPALRDDRDLYAALGLSFVPAEQREDEGEIERAARGEPFDLVEVGDLRGFVHCHTKWSDGKGSIEEMARAAELRGASYLTITDHSKSAHYANGLDAERLRRQWDEIDEVQSRVGIRILRGKVRRQSPDT